MFKSINSFKCAFKGIGYCLKNERHMRIHVCAAIYVLIFSTFFKLSLQEYAILLLAILGVIASEMVNTAIEVLSDLCATDYNILAKISKDIAAGVVLACAILSIIIGIFLFFKKEPILFIFFYFKTHLLMLFIFLISLILAILYIGFGSNGLKNKFKKYFFKLKNFMTRRGNNIDSKIKN